MCGVAWYTVAVVSSNEPLALHSPELSNAGFRHAFFTRHGGISRPPYDTLNFSLATGDLPEAVKENMNRAASELGVGVDRVYFLNQVHGVGVVQLDGSESRTEVLKRDGDILVSASTAAACGVRTADCGPLLFADRRTGLVAAAHAGWWGTVEGVVAASLEALTELGSQVLDIIVAVGPMIERCCFEVGEDVAQLIAASGNCGEEVIDRDKSKPHVDLRQVIEAQLRGSGISSIDHVRVCTHCDKTRFHSYRRDGKIGGRMLSAIVGRG